MAELLGTIGMLQVHRSAVKANERYDPAPLLNVSEASFDAGGMVGWDGMAWIMDNHHRAYPGNEGGWRRAISVGFSAHYAAMKARFGDRVVPGIAGENIIIDVDRFVSLEDLEPGIVIQGASGATLQLDEPLVAAPCREFTSCLLGLPERAERDEISEHLAFLDDGTRGYVFGCRHVVDPVTLRVGDAVYLAG